MAMVDVSGKEIVARRAVAQGKILLGERSLTAIKTGQVRKGDVLTFAEAAGLLAIKKVPESIPHCHPIPVTAASVSFEVKDDGVLCQCTVEATYKTGVEMEALAGASKALLTIWDMVKYLEKDEDGQYPHTKIVDLAVKEKRKG